MGTTTTNNNANGIINAVNNGITAGTFGINIVTRTEPQMNKTGNEFYGRVIKFTKQKNVALGISYQAQCENRQEKSGSERGYNVEAQKGMHRFDKFFNQSDKDENQFYLKVGYRGNSDCRESYYFIDGKPATNEQMIELAKWLPEERKSDKQLGAGISEENLVTWRVVKVQNVLSIKQGARVVYGEDFDNFAEFILQYVG